jgi:hypothetical protein
MAKDDGVVGVGFTIEMRSMKPPIKERTIYGFSMEAEDSKPALDLMNDLEMAVEAILNRHKIKPTKMVVKSDRFNTPEADGTSPIREETK